MSRLGGRFLNFRFALILRAVISRISSCLVLGTFGSHFSVTGWDDFLSMHVVFIPRDPRALRVLTYGLFAHVY